MSPAQAALIVELRRRWPSFGPCKLKAKLAELYPEQSWPAPSTIGDLLCREGLSKRQRTKRRSAGGGPGPLLGALYPNQVWAIDFHGSLRTSDGKRCDPLPISDSYSRCLLCCWRIAPPLDHTNWQP